MSDFRLRVLAALFVAPPFTAPLGLAAWLVLAGVGAIGWGWGDLLACWAACAAAFFALYLLRLTAFAVNSDPPPPSSAPAGASRSASG